MKKSWIAIGAILLFTVGLSGCQNKNVFAITSGANQNKVELTKKEYVDIKGTVPKRIKYVGIFSDHILIDSVKAKNHKFSYKTYGSGGPYKLVLLGLSYKPQFGSSEYGYSNKHKIVLSVPATKKKAHKQKVHRKSRSSSYSSSLSSSKPKTTPKPRKKAFDRSEYSTAITYDQLARTPDQYEDKLVALTGKVIQVLDGKSETDLRVAINGNYDDVVIVAYDPDIMHGKRVLENDKITFYGKSYGVTTYKSTIGEKITVPLVIVKVIDDYGEAPDDYGE